VTHATSVPQSEAKVNIVSTRFDDAEKAEKAGVPPTVETPVA
jgi:hypothetical protein